MTGTLRLLRIETRRNVGLLLLPALLVSAWLFATRLWTDLSFLWTYALEMIQISILGFGPVLAGTAAWMAARDHRRGIEELLASTPRPETERRLVLWSATAVWGLLAYLLFAGIMLGRTWLQATWGGPDLGRVAIGLAAIPAMGAVGFAAGTYLPSRFTAPLVAAGTLALQDWLADRWTVHEDGSMSQGGVLNYLAVHYGHEDLFMLLYYQIDALSGPRILFYLGVMGLALGAVALRGGWGRGTLLALGLAAATAIAGVAGIASAVSDRFDPATGTRSTLAREPIPYEPVCSQTPLRVCVHPAYEPILDEAAAEVNRLAEPLIGLPGMPAEIRLHDYQLGPGGLAGSRFIVAQDLVMSEEGRGVQVHTDEDGLNIAQDLVLSEERHWQGSADAAQIALRSWLLQRVGEQDLDCRDVPWGEGPAVQAAIEQGCAAAERFAALPPEEQRRWLEANFARVRAGQLDPEELP